MGHDPLPFPLRPLPPFSCPKCGSRNTKVEYFGPYRTTLDYLKHLCYRCRYSWTTPPLDRKEPK